ncbi:scarecrow-like protein 27 [Dendrobium catenatum]|uniref:Scarecrow-like protein 6 n=1 Tax=Dendrobium catenatum TaxID=906689 RepID=A0A2I0W6G8_9ASPA|nr:scarecrow-like protein 27 [Dendrobium catenatum]PKU71251.1 Scarecrow-like protein 6 [Dendrobium catenatum]
MRGMPFSLSGKGALEAIAAQILGEEDKGGTFWSGCSHRKRKGEVLEPRSVLYHRRSPSPPTSTSTLSSSLSSGGGGGGGGSTETGGVAAVSENPSQRKEEWATELHPIAGSLEMSGIVSAGEKCGIGADDWETMLTSSAASPNQEQTFLRWIMGDIDDPSSASKHHHYHQVPSQAPPVEFDAGITVAGFGLVDPLLGFEPIGGIAGTTSSGGFYQGSRNIDGKKANFINPPSGMTFQEPTDEKPQLFSPNLLQTNISPNPAFFLPSSSLTAATAQHQTSNLLSPHPKRHQSMPHDSAFSIPSLCAGQLQAYPYQLQQRLMKPRPSLAGNDAASTAAMALQQHQALIDQLFETAELVEAGNFISAHGILARLNHQLSSPLGKPLLRSAFYFKEALQVLVANSYNPPLVTSSPSHHHRTPFTTSLFTPLDVVLKLSAYKTFSEVSPVLHFTNFTVTQALLEELGTADCIHIIDFDIGIGGQWSSFIHELAQRRRSSTAPRLKITAFVSLCAFHPLELHLTRENLAQFAADLNIPFEINISSLESFDPVEILAVSAGCNEIIAVNLPVGSALNPSFSTLLRLVKQLTPKIVMSVDQGCDRSDLPFSHHFLHALQSSMILLDSIDAAGSNMDMSNKIERFILQPKIENCIIGRYRAADKMLQWRTLFASAGFVPVQFSNFTEMQAECLLKRVQVRGFHVEKRQASLYLYWQRGELVSISAWRC